MRISGRILAVLAIMWLAAACATQSQTSTQGVNFVPGQTKIALMPLDVNLFLLTAGGVQEPRADWTEAAKVHVANAIDVMRQQRGLQLTNFNENDLSPGHQQLVAQVVKLHRVVGGEILVQQRLPALRPPHKEGTFDWSIGPHAQLVRQATGADYGLFVSLRDSYSSGARVALGIVTAVLFGAPVQGGQQIGYASLVHLESGNVVWFGSLARGTGDLRTAEPAQSAINDLFSGLPQS